MMNHKINKLIESIKEKNFGLNLFDKYVENIELVNKIINENIFLTDIKFNEQTMKYNFSNQENNYSFEQQKYIFYNGLENTKLIGIPGGGKTKCVIGRIQFLISNKFYSKNEIFVLTFSRFAMNDFKKRCKNIPNQNKF